MISAQILPEVRYGKDNTDDRKENGQSNMLAKAFITVIREWPESHVQLAVVDSAHAQEETEQRCKRSCHFLL